MNNYMTVALVCTALAWVAPAAAQGTQNVYRCGNTYSQQPCADGKLVAASDSRSAAQKSQTDEATKRDSKAADAMEKARVKEEAKPVPVGMPADKPASAQKDTKKSERKTKKSKSKKDEHFTAVAPKKPGEEPVKKKAKKDQ
ncbi:hypothetical protein [Ramlibacter sp. WS9]|uniref:hypothetical protein n=1 Tax=Ramlibacter sp. WS9 TaxID=1882741 RepID=UPI001141CD25|nr:hypothetical protein [Ramlibacter sp. WS9]ROZ79712.1 hypothetical protein EEB15_02055 [Ramlibacter sp. WS9]